MKNGKIDKVLFDGGYAQASVATKTTDKFAFNFYNQDHLGNNREVVDAKGVVQQVTTTIRLVLHTLMLLPLNVTVSSHISTTARSLT